MEEINIEEITLEFTPFTFSYGFDLSVLIESIKKVGLLNEPILKKHKEKLVIVTGYKRILSLKEIGSDRVRCKLISEPDFECFLINFYENLSIRSFNEIEKAIILSKLLNYVSETEIINNFMPLLGLPKHKPVFDFYVWIEKDLDQKVKELFVKGRISLKSIRMFYEWNFQREDIMIYAEYMNKLKFSFNEQRQFIEYSRDICEREKISLKELFKELEIDKIASDKEMSNSLKTKKILERLYKKRFPRLFSIETSFRKTVEELSLPEEVTIVAPQNFEAPYRMEIRFRDGKELKEKISRIDLKKIEGLKDPWR